MSELLDTALPWLGNSLFFLTITVGVLGSIVPGVPGSILIWAAALVHGLVTGFDPLSGGYQLGLLLLLGISVGGQFALSVHGARRYGSTGWGVAGASVGLLLGFLIPIPIAGPIVGAFLGAAAAESFIAQRERDEAARAGLGAVLGAVLGLAAEFGVSLVMAGLCVAAFLFG